MDRFICSPLCFTTSHLLLIVKQRKKHKSAKLEATRPIINVVSLYSVRLQNLFLMHHWATLSVTTTIYFRWHRRINMDQSWNYIGRGRFVPVPATLSTTVPTWNTLHWTGPPWWESGYYHGTALSIWLTCSCQYICTLKHGNILIFVLCPDVLIHFMFMVPCIVDLY